MVRGSILVADDDALFRAALARYLESEQYAVTAVGDPEAGLAKLRQRPFDLVLSDLKMPGIDGIEFIRQIRQIDAQAVCILITGYGSPERSIEALDAGAFWFVEKSYEQIESFGPLIAKALEFRQLQRSNRRLQRQLSERFGFENIIGDAPALRETLDLVRRVADTDATVLLLGESGSGKELFARALHFNHEKRCEGPYVAVNCGAIPEELLESELFGHVKGAFTGASRDREGRFAQANGGTLLLDEIGDMSPTLQIKLLRVLQERSFEPVGSNRTESVDVRIIAATHQDLPTLIRDGRFREDLYFRLNVVPIGVPALRDRREDVPQLIEHFVAHQRVAYPELKGFTAPAVAQLLAHDWPGNVRELQALVERLAILKRSGWIDEDDLPRDLSTTAVPRPPVTVGPDGVDFHAVVDRLESELILQALDETGWNKNRAAQLLGLKRTTLVEKIRSKGLTPPE